MVSPDLLALCGHCHDLHTQGHIPKSAISHWKGILHALNHAFSKESMDLLLFLNKPESEKIWFSGDGVLKFASLIAAGLAEIKGSVYANAIKIPGPSPSSSHHIKLTQKGKDLVEAWLAGDEIKYKNLLIPSGKK